MTPATSMFSLLNNLTSSKPTQEYSDSSQEMKIETSQSSEEEIDESFFSEPKEPRHSVKSPDPMKSTGVLFRPRFSRTRSKAKPTYLFILDEFPHNDLFTDLPSHADLLISNIETSTNHSAAYLENGGFKYKTKLEEEELLANILLQNLTPREIIDSVFKKMVQRILYEPQNYIGQVFANQITARTTTSVSVIRIVFLTAQIGGNPLLEEFAFKLFHAAAKIFNKKNELPFILMLFCDLGIDKLIPDTSLYFIALQLIVIFFKFTTLSARKLENKIRTQLNKGIEKSLKRFSTPMMKHEVVRLFIRKLCEYENDFDHMAFDLFSQNCFFIKV